MDHGKPGNMTKILFLHSSTLTCLKIHNREQCFGVRRIFSVSVNIVHVLAVLIVDERRCYRMPRGERILHVISGRTLQ